MILFPNLGLEFEHVRTGISVFGFEITFFGIILGFALLLGIILTLLGAYSTGQNMDEYLNLSIIVVPAALIGARIYYVIFHLDSYKDAIRKIFMLRKGGLEFYGALIAGIITILIYANVQKVSSGKILDTASIGIAAGQILCTVGAYFNRECFGDYTDGLFAMQIPLDEVSYYAVTENMRKHIEMIDGQRFIQVRPLFFATFLWSIIVLTVVLLYKYRKKFDGELFQVYLQVYSLGRFLIEGARADALLIPKIGWRASRVIAVVMIIISVLMMLYIWTQNDKARMKRVKDREAKKFSKKSRGKMYLN